MKVPFVDLHAQYLAHRTEIDSALQAVIDQTAFVGGAFVQRFEADYAAAYGVERCVGVANGTDAIYIALKMLGIGPGDEVITTAVSWISTSETITQTGATAVFVDVDEYFNIDPSLIEAKITPRTKAILPVHLYGQPARMDRIRDICDVHGLRLVEDCAQAHFAEFAGRRVGMFGDVATFSFYPGKNLGAYGDAGAIITSDTLLADQCRMYANHGALRKHEHEIEGLNSRLDGLQAAILSAKLRHIHDWTAKRREVAGWYDRELAELDGVVTPATAPGATHVYHLYVVRVRDREALIPYLAEHGIQTGIHYPRALPFLPAYARFGHRPADFPVAFRNQSEILSLPMYPELSREMVDFVCRRIADFYGL